MPTKGESCPDSKFSAIILAAGIGKRMYAKTPKILHKILGKPIIQFVVDLAINANSSEIVLVVSRNHQPDIKKLFGHRIKYAIQEIPRGTGDAAKKGVALAKYDNVLILYGDVPLLTRMTLNKMIAYHRLNKAALTVLTCKMTDPSGYGRIIRGKGKQVTGIVEQTDADAEQEKINEINTGVYYGKREAFVNALARIKAKNKQTEYYLTDIIKELVRTRKKVVGYRITNEQEIFGVNSRSDMAKVREIVRNAWFAELMNRGVYIEDPLTTIIDLTVKIGDFVQIKPFALIEGKTSITDNCVVGPFAWIKNNRVMNNKVGSGSWQIKKHNE